MGFILCTHPCWPVRISFNFGKNGISRFKAIRLGHFGVGGERVTRQLETSPYFPLFTLISLYKSSQSLAEISWGHHTPSQGRYNGQGSGYRDYFKGCYTWRGRVVVAIIINNGFSWRSPCVTHYLSHILHLFITIISLSIHSLYCLSIIFHSAFQFISLYCR